MVKKNSDIEALELINERNAIRIKELKDDLAEAKQTIKKQARECAKKLKEQTTEHNRILKEKNLELANKRKNYAKLEQERQDLHKRLKAQLFELSLLDQYRKDVELFQKRDKIYIESEIKVKEYDSMIVKFTKQIETMKIAYKELESYVDKKQLEQFYQSKVCQS